MGRKIERLNNDNTIILNIEAKERERCKTFYIPP